MSTNWHAQLFIGIPVTRADFWEVTGPPIPMCERRHLQEGAKIPKYCPECGSPVTRSKLQEKATPKFVTYAADLGTCPEDLWEDLNQDDTSENPFLVSNEDHGWGAPTEPTELFFGFSVLKDDGYSRYRNNGEMVTLPTVDPKEIPALVAKVLGLADLLGFENREPRLVLLGDLS